MGVRGCRLEGGWGEWGELAIYVGQHKHLPTLYYDSCKRGVCGLGGGGGGRNENHYPRGVGWRKSPVDLAAFGCLDLLPRGRWRGLVGAPEGFGSREGTTWKTQRSVVLIDTFGRAGCVASGCGARVSVGRGAAVRHVWWDVVSRITGGCGGVGGVGPFCFGRGPVSPVGQVYGWRLASVKAVVSCASLWWPTPCPLYLMTLGDHPVRVCGALSSAGLFLASATVVVKAGRGWAEFWWRHWRGGWWGSWSGRACARGAACG